MNTLSKEDRVRVVACLVEGNSLRATVRMTGVHRTTIQNLLVELGEACQKYQDAALRNLTCKRIQCDEIWSFVYAKEKNLPQRQLPKQPNRLPLYYTSMIRAGDISSALIFNHLWRDA